MNEEISEELEEIASRLTSHRGNAEEQNYSGSTGDVVTRLEKIGIHTHKAKVAEVADLLYDDILFRLKAGLVLIDEIGEHSGVPTPLAPSTNAS